MINAISCKNLVKDYRKHNGGTMRVLDIEDLQIKQGGFFGILGPNGAGKSTLINIVSSLTKQTSGTVSVFGKDVPSNLEFAKNKIGTAIQDIKLDPFLRVYETLEYQSGYYGIPKSKRITEEIMHNLGLLEHRDKKTRMLSGGMQRRLVIAKALVHSPEIIILDEPTAGVDIELRSQLWSFIKKLNSQGKTIIVTTHYLEEAQTLCDEIAFIKSGRIIMQNSKRKILSLLDKKAILIQAPNVKDIDIKSPNITMEKGEKFVKVTYAPSVTSTMDVLHILQKSGLEIQDFVIQDPSLDEIFSHVIGR